MTTMAVSSNGGDTPVHAVFSQVNVSDGERLILNFMKQIVKFLLRLSLKQVVIRPSVVKQ